MSTGSIGAYRNNIAAIRDYLRAPDRGRLRLYFDPDGVNQHARFDSDLNPF